MFPRICLFLFQKYRQKDQISNNFVRTNSVLLFHIILRNKKKEKWEKAKKATTTFCVFFWIHKNEQNNDLFYWHIYSDCKRVTFHVQIHSWWIVFFQHSFQKSNVQTLRMKLKLLAIYRTEKKKFFRISKNPWHITKYRCVISTKPQKKKKNQNKQKKISCWSEWVVRNNTTDNFITNYFIFCWLLFSACNQKREEKYWLHIMWKPSTISNVGYHDVFTFITI